MNDAPPIEPPPITTVRYNEDYSYLRDSAQRSGAWWEAFKYMPLTASGEVYLTLGSEARVRFEVFRNENFGEGAGDEDGYLWLRALPLADLHAGKHVRLFGQFITAFGIAREPSGTPIDENRLDALQVFADLNVSVPSDHVTGRAGRQMLAYGSERLISNRYGPNVPQTFDGLKAFANLGLWHADVFWARPVENDIKVMDDESDDTRGLWSLYATRCWEGQQKNGLDLYYIGYNNDAAVFNQGSGLEERHTLGTRIFGNHAQWDWNTELFYQFGTFGRGDISAWSAASDTGYTFSEHLGSPRLSLKANIVSGDDDPADPDLQTFNALFPKGKYFGEIGLLGPYNLINLHPALELQLGEKWSASLAGVFFWRENTNDGVYGNSGNLIRSDGSESAHYIGTQTDLALNYRPFRYLELEAAVSHFAPGAFIQQTGRSDDVWFGAVEVRFIF